MTTRSTMTAIGIAMTRVKVVASIIVLRSMREKSRSDSVCGNIFGCWVV